MDFLNDLKKNLTDTAKDVKKKSEDMVEITRLSVAISSDEEKLKKMLYELGAEIYKDYCDKPEENPSPKRCIEIFRLEEAIKHNREKILLLRGNTECTSCNAVVDLDANFCPKCGAKLDKPEPPMVTEEGIEYHSLEEEEP